MDGRQQYVTNRLKYTMFKTFALNYEGGERFSNLFREAGTIDLLSQISRPRTSPSPR